MSRKRRSVGAVTLWALAQLNLLSLGAEPFVVPLEDDRQTRGDWVGVCGRHAHILCGMRRPASSKGGRGWPIEFEVTTPKKDDPARAWISTMNAENDRRVLWHSTAKKRVASSWDDHGEVYKRGTGPNLHVSMSIQAGTFMLSLYFFEIDWIQYRDLGLKVYIQRGKQFEIATSGRVSDFFGGVYKRFAVGGPARLKIVIERDLSPNAVVSGVFLDVIGEDESRTLAALLPPGPPAGKAEIKSLEAVSNQRLVAWEKSRANAQAARAYVEAEAKLSKTLRAQQRSSPRHYYVTSREWWRRARARADRARTIADKTQMRIWTNTLYAESCYALYDFNSSREATDIVSRLLLLLGEAPAERDGALDRLEALAKPFVDQNRREDAREPCRAYSTACAKWLPEKEAAKRLQPLAREAMLLHVGDTMAPAYEALVRRYDEPPFDLLLVLANLYYVSGNAKNAIPNYVAAIRRMPKGSRHRWALVALLSCYLQEGRDGEAIGAYSKLAKEYPKNDERFEAQLRIARSFFHRRRYTEAEKWFRTLISSGSPKYADIAKTYLKRMRRGKKGQP